MARSRNVYTSSAILTLIPLHSNTLLLWRLDIAGSNRTYLRLRVKCPIFLSDFNQIWIFRTGFHKCPQYRISHKNPSSGIRANTGTWRSYGYRGPGREADHSPPPRAEVKKWSYTSTPPICHHVLQRVNTIRRPLYQSNERSEQ